MSTALGFSGFTDGDLNGQGRWLTVQGQHEVFITSETAGIHVGGANTGRRIRPCVRFRRYGLAYQLAICQRQ